MCRTATALAALACAILVRSDPIPKPTPSSPPDTSETRRISNLQLMHPMPYLVPGPVDGNHGNRDEPFSNIPPEAFTLDTNTDSKRTFKKDLSQVIYSSNNYIDAADIDNNDISDAYVIVVKREEGDDDVADDEEEYRVSEHTLETFTTDDYEEIISTSTAPPPPPPSPSHLHNIYSGGKPSLADEWNFMSNYMHLLNPHSNSIFSNHNRQSKPTSIPIEKQHIIDIFTNELGTRHEPMTPFVNRRPSIYKQAQSNTISHNEHYASKKERHHPQKHYDLNQKRYGTNKQHYISNKEHYDPNKQHYYVSNKGHYDSNNGINKGQYGSDMVYYGLDEKYGSNKDHYGLHKQYESDKGEYSSTKDQYGDAVCADRHYHPVGTRRGGASAGAGWLVLGQGTDQRGEPVLVV